MTFTSDREASMMSVSVLGIWRSCLIVLALMLGSMAVRADDPQDRQVSFDIEPTSLAKALVQYALQSGVQVAVADSDVANRQSGGLTGTYSAHDALARLLLGTGLEFSQVGASTLAIRSASSLPVVAKTPVALPDVSVISPRAVTDQELSGDSVYEFIVHHATTHYPKSQGVVGTLARWRGGRPETLCPVTMGLDPGYNAYVTARLRAIAGAVGAPVQSDPHCKNNVWIFFTTEPEKLMSGVLKRAIQSIGVKYLHETDRELQVSGAHPVQGWYLTSGGGAGILNKDASMIGPVNLLALWPYAIPTGLHSIDGLGGIVSTILVIDTAKVAGYTIGSIADYVAMTTLSVVQSPDHCDPLPSILDLMAPSCDEREKPTGITAGDMAFLKALYFHNTGIGPTLSRDDIKLNMLRQLKRQ